MDDYLFPPLTKQHVLNCAFAIWYPIFRRVTIKSEIIPIPADFLDYLHQDGVFLPLDSNGMPQPSYETPKDEYDTESESESENENNNDNEWGKIPDFPEFQETIAAKIDSLGGSVFPKLNWSSPKDACWMALGQTMQCKTAADIFLLLKSSDFIAHDLTCPFEACVAEIVEGHEDISKKSADSYDLILRKWYELHPSMEFRCFVKDGVLVGICQRDYLNHYPFLVSSRLTLESAITNFFKNEINGKFLNASYVFDVYMNKNNQRVWLLDFNPFSIITDSLLFEWNEILQHEGTEGMGLRVVLSNGETGLQHQPMYATNRIPKDAIDLSDGKTLAEFAQKMVEEMALAQASPPQ
ncbi:hypothetical protein HK100_009681 [Physocladia obscura]|uniref:Cell division cycle protein 123 n=1 Tax=Physocladia obscura TaxID=109957 RepID=A0AAD5XAZ5_9FUNG|nr:hypothetical protein HK100_009681 [Physocladia obscura]